MRALITCFALAGCFTAFSARLVHLQVTMHEYYASIAARNHGEKVTIQARRGRISDIHDEILAQNEPIKTVIADGALIKDRAEMAAILAGPLGLPEAEILTKLGRTYFSSDEQKRLPSRYIVLKKEVKQDEADQIRTLLAAKKLRGIEFEQASNRVYPNGGMLCHILGYVDHAGLGVEGVERTMEQYLCGRDGFRYIERDRKGREIVAYRGEEHPARNGGNVRLTVDIGLQNIVEQELDAVVKEYHPKGATIILMQPRTGAILALANRPNFNLNKQDGANEEDRRNRAITDMVEPGSTFKIVTVSAALSERLVRPGTEIDVENGYYSWCHLHDDHAAAALTVNDILVKSSNIGVAKLAMQLGDEKFYEYVRRYGFGERTSLALPGEISGVVHPPRDWSKWSITRMPMGQEVTATPIQIATAMCAIANGGMLLMPQIVSEITDDTGKVVSTFPPREIRRVVSKQASDEVRAALVDVVKRGTASKFVHVAGYKVAGKTGTAQKYVDKRPSHEKFVSSFVGFMPADDPAFVALVLLDEPKMSGSRAAYGGAVAGPVFAHIAERAARYLGLVPTEVEGPTVAARQTTNVRAR
jgi:cell division protein FtsI (penicillin-binding protein 3)/stage V sporulation protein D (sporulation-specific penicillin-binding protein)